MSNLKISEELIGPAAFGVKMGVILPETNVKKKIIEKIKTIDDKILSEGDTLCITENIVARTQNNYVTVDEIAEDVRNKLGIDSDSNLGIVFPILSRNRFSMILQSLARAVKDGKLSLQLSFPDDEVGNPIINREIMNNLGKNDRDNIEYNEIKDIDFQHPLTEVNYLDYYKDIIEREGAEADIFLNNDPSEILKRKLDGVIAADIHTREKTKQILDKDYLTCTTLDEICNEGENSSKWGLLGTNMASSDRLKLLPQNGDKFVHEIQDKILEETGKKVHVLIYGDGAYKDPSSGIYELADPSVTFGATDSLKNKYRRGVKYKLLADKFHEEGLSEEEIEEKIREKHKEHEETKRESDIEAEGTTPRKITDVLGSLSDLVSGSGDAGTPIVLIKNLF
ncbi:MAG: coenzyme F420-0:L-glutamate ligase [Candidatus Magasanikbacteria bacterium]